MTGAKKQASNETSTLDKGWSWMVVLASFGGFFIVNGSSLGVSVMHSALLDRYQASVTLTSWVGSLHSSLVAIGGQIVRMCMVTWSCTVRIRHMTNGNRGRAPLASLLIDRTSCRVALITSGIGYMVGYIATAFAPDVWVAIVTCGIISGLAGALGFTTSMVVVGFNFERKINIANGISSSGSGVGLSVFPPLLQIAREYYGTTGFFIILAAMTANLITFGSMCFPTPLEEKAKRDKKMDQSKSTSLGLNVYKTVIMSKPILFMSFSLLTYCIGVYSIFLHSASYAKECGFTLLEASMFLSIMGGVNILGRILTGLVANLKLVDGVYLYSGSTLILSLETFLFPLFAKYFAGQIFHAIMWGLFYGGVTVVIPSICIRYVGIKFLSSAVGLIYFHAGIGCLVGPILGAIVYDSIKSYVPTVLFSASCILMTSILSAATTCFPSLEHQGDSHEESHESEHECIPLSTEGHC